MPSQGTEPVHQLSQVLPSTLRALGGAGADQSEAAANPLGIPACRRAIVVLVDGLGAELLAARASYAPYLAGLLEGSPPTRCGYPSTTATSIASFGTGLPPGGHGMFGYQVLNPASGTLFNELSWENGPDPREWQPVSPVFSRSVEAGIRTFQIGPGFFQGSGLTTAALRGAEFHAALTLDQRVDAAASLVRSAPRTLVYLYWGDVDKTGHAEGCGSQKWVEELQAVDFAVRELARRAPKDTAIVVTADHGMIDIPGERRLNLADPGLGQHLSRGVRLTGGEPRAPMLYCEPGQAEIVAERWQAEVGDDFEVLLTDDAIAAGWFGHVDPVNRDRLGHVVAAGTTDAAIFDTRFQSLQQLKLVGFHGARTSVEASIPLLIVPPGA